MLSPSIKAFFLSTLLLGAAACTTSVSPQAPPDQASIGTTSSALTDSFSSGSLDPAQWTVNATIPQGEASVFVRDGAAVITNRAHLNTASQFDPYAMGGGLRVTGEWTFAGADQDFMQIFTRSDGVPTGDYGDTGNGIQFGAYMQWGGLSQHIWISGNGAAEVSGAQAAPLAINPGDTFLFEIIDSPPNVSFRLTHKDDSSRTATVTATSSFHPATNFVTFHNREFQGGFNTAELRNVKIEAIESCSDGIKNGNETDVDCGGSCGKCSTGKSCASANDCSSSSCSNGSCQQVYENPNVHPVCRPYPVFGPGCCLYGVHPMCQSSPAIGPGCCLARH